MEPTGPRVIEEQCYCAPTPATRLAPELRCLAWVDLPRGARAVPAAVLRLHLWSPLLPPFSSHAPPRWSPAGDESPTSMSHVHSVPWVQFQVLLTRLSAFFSTFVRTTSPLSVFVSYLDLGEVYLLLCAALTSNTTLRHREIWLLRTRFKGLSPSLARLSYRLYLDFATPAPRPKGASAAAHYSAAALFL